jgi:hypothetical protein
LPTAPVGLVDQVAAARLVLPADAVVTATVVPTAQTAARAAPPAQPVAAGVAAVQPETNTNGPTLTARE